VQPQSQALVAGTNFVLTVAATGASPLNYQWQLNGTDVAGASMSTLARTNVNSADAGSYVAVVSNPGGAVTSLVAAVTVNNPPVLDLVSGLTAHAGAIVQVANAAADPDPGQVLTFSFDPGAPAGAFINAADGLVTWPTTDADANTTNAVTVRVTDNGDPPLNDAQGFTITVLGRPVILSTTLAINLMVFTWSAIPGQTYRVQYKINLADAEWAELVDVVAAGATATAADSTTSSSHTIPCRFYRVLVVE
jgi:hypothetical protein